MLISFIIPIYNLPEWMLCDCLKSIKRLSLCESEYEVVAVDDGSKVSAEATIREVFPQAVVIKKPNGGLSSARNAGIEVSRGDYVQFLDGDDELLPSYKEVIKTLKENRLDLLMFRFSRKKANSSLSRLKLTEITAGAEFMANYNLRASACSYIVSRKVIGNVRFPIGMLHEDELFTPLVLLRSERMADCNIKAYYYRSRTGSITKRQDEAHIKLRLGDTFRIISLLNDKTKSLRGIQQAAMQRRVAQLSMDYLYNALRFMPQKLHESAKKLCQVGLFPLPKGNYTIKYRLFRCIINKI